MSLEVTDVPESSSPELKFFSFGPIKVFSFLVHGVSSPVPGIPILQILFFEEDKENAELEFPEATRVTLLPRTVSVLRLLRDGGTENNRTFTTIPTFSEILK